MACVLDWQLNGRRPHNYKPGAFWGPRWVSYRSWLVAYQPHHEVKFKASQEGSSPEVSDSLRRNSYVHCRRLLYQTGAHRFIYSLVLDRCCGQVLLLWFFCNPPHHPFPTLLHIDNVSVASQISEESGTWRIRSFLAATAASISPTTPASGAYVGVIAFMSVIYV